MPDKPLDNRKQESLDEIVSHSAVVLADQIQKAAQWAKSEMDLQIEVAGALKEFARKAQIKLEGHHNITIATGRPDSVYGSVIVEYKDPGTLSPSKDAAPNKAVIEQLKRRFFDLNREEKRNWPSMFGVGTDGKYFVFLRFRDDKWTDQEPLEVNRYSTERFLWALYNLGQKGKPYQPEYLHGDFGSGSPVAQEGVRTLYEEILATENPRAQVFFNQWKILFGEVCGYDVENLSDKLKKLAEFYTIKGKPQPAPLLFALHTYYAVLIKLLAAEIVSFFNPWLPRQVEKLLNATTSQKLKRELEQLESGGIFHEMGITNFLEGDLFSWYLAVWSEPIEKLMRQMIIKLDEYNPGTFSEDPAQSRDLLKKLYQQLFPKSVRHDLGEYYTPDWLAEHVLNELGFEGDPDKRLLDPACGSGTFLVMAINRIRHWYDANREKCAYDEGDLLNKILANVVGFDLNPLAVMAARTNYLVAIKDLIRHVDRVEIPVYLCDSIVTRAEYRNLFTEGPGKVAKVPCSAMKPPHLLVPKEVAKTPKEVARYAEVLESCIKDGFSSEEFLSRCTDEGLVIKAEEAHIDLYRELVQLDKENKNGIWARIIKNNFAPLFEDEFDFIAGNPPWIAWDSLPESYRKDISPLWKAFGLFALTDYEAFRAMGKVDISMLFVYASSDFYLKEKGKLGFVITQTVFKSRGAGDGFRGFSLPSTSLACHSVHDFSAMQPFEGATNKTSTVFLEKGAKTTYPVRYFAYELAKEASLSSDDSWERVLKKLRAVQLEARPVSSENLLSPWLTLPKGLGRVLERIKGASKYHARKGVCTDLNGAFWVEVLHENKDRGLSTIRNLTEAGKNPVPRVQETIESDFVMPLIRGRNVSKWHVLRDKSIVFVQDRENHWSGIPENELKRMFPKTHAFFHKFEKQLRARKPFIKYLAPQGVPFYTIRDVGEYTYAPFKTVWREQASGMISAVVDTAEWEKPPIVDHKLILVPFQSADEAYYLCGVLNCSAINQFVRAYAVLTQISTHVTKFIQIPTYDPKSRVHHRICELAKSCHRAATRRAEAELQELELELDETAMSLWGFSAEELKQIRKAVASSEKPRRSRHSASEDH